MTASELAQQVKAAAAEVGFDRCGIAPAARIQHEAELRLFLEEKRAGRMGYLYRHLRSRIDVRAWLTWSNSVIVTALNYHQPEPVVPDQRPRGRVAMYAWGKDYHQLVRQKLEHMVERLRVLIPESFEAKICVDTSAITERELAAMSGIGWIGKNTLVLNQTLGSYFVLGEIITSLPLPPDPPESDHCGSCTRCLDACPTAAFPRAYQMDPRRCISYLTIEHRGELDAELTARMGEWVFGCDICQQVCPYNREAPLTEEPALLAASPEAARPPLAEVAAWDEAEYQAFAADRAVARARLAMWKRNAEIAKNAVGGAEGS